MPDSQIEEIKSKTDIVGIIGEHVQLTKAGSNFRGLCPFHQEKTPSFMVSPELQIYKCFGCSEGGDVFSFLEKYEGMEFGEALRFLAEKTGVKLTSFSGIPASDKDLLYQINAYAAKFYNYLLTSHQVGKSALNYVKEERKISVDSIKTFNIGFAPVRQNALSNFLIKKKKFTAKDLQKAGVVFISKSGRVFDRFEGRIVFPICDHRGNVIALAGRQLPPGNPKQGKYINSPETLIYHKSSSLYGLNITKEFIKKEGFAVIVEGEIDLISSFQIGIKNIVAIKGSAFTPDQARLLSRYTKKVILALDTDFAGVKASIRGIKILEDADFEIEVVDLGKYKDPDEATGNPQFYKEKIKNAVPVWDFIIKKTLEQFDKTTASGKAKIGRELTPILHEIKNKIVQEHYVRKLSKLLEVSEEAVFEEVEKEENKKENFPKIKKTEDIAASTKPRSQVKEERLIALILASAPSLLKNKKVISLITTPILVRLVKEYDPKTPSGKNLPKELFDKFGELVLSVESDDKKELKDEVNELYRLISLQKIRESYKISQDEKESVVYQKQYKDFESGNFERII